MLEDSATWGGQYFSRSSLHSRASSAWASNFGGDNFLYDRAGYGTGEWSPGMQRNLSVGSEWEANRMLNESGDFLEKYEMRYHKMKWMLESYLLKWRDRRDIAMKNELEKKKLEMLKMEEAIKELEKSMDINKNADLRELSNELDHNQVVQYIKQEQGKVGGINQGINS